MENEEKSPEFGRYLRTHRRSKGISLEVVSQKTKITVASLRHLEDEELDKLPAPAFVKGFIHAYAEVVGVDAQEAVRRYEDMLAPLAEREPGAVALPLDSLSTVGRRSWRPMIWAGLGCLLFGVAVFFLIRQFNAPEETPPPEMVSTPQTSDQGEEPVVESLPPETKGTDPEEMPNRDEEMLEVEVGSNQADTPVAETDQEPVGVGAPETLPQAPIPDTQEAVAAPQETIATEPAPAVEEMVLIITAIERTWLRVTIDQEIAKEVTIDPQDKITLKAQKQFELFIGNAGGIKLELDGKAVDVPGGSGKVAKMRLP